MAVRTLPPDQALALATTLLQRMRLDQPTGGIWEAADVQWWSRQERASDADGQLFWLDRTGEPVAAVIRTDFGGGSVQCDVLVLADDPDFEQAVWRAAISRAEALGKATEFPVRLDNAVGVAGLTAAGYSPSDEPAVVACWLDADRRPGIPALPPGYRLLSRADSPGRPYPLAARNGPQAEGRLRRCSLYRPELDLMVVAPDGQTAGYGLFWADPVTKVGLVEPMRTEQAYQGRGIAGHILAVGLDRLAVQGCRRLKVSNDLGLYLRGGFSPLPSATAPVYLRSLP